MDAYLIVAVPASLCCIGLGIYVLSQDCGSTLNRLFLLMSITLGGLIFEGNRMFVADTVDILVSRYKISTFLFAAFFALNLHFFAVFTRRELKHYQTIFIYLPVLVITINPFIGQSMFSGYIRNGAVWEPVPAYDGFGLYISVIYVVMYMLVSIFLMEQHRRKTDLNKEKRQAFIISSAYFATTTFALTSTTFFPAFDIYLFSRLSPNAFLIYCFAIFYIVFRLEFLNISPSIMVDEIIEHIGEMILLLGNDYRIIMGNKKTLEIMDISQENLNRKSFFDIVRDNETIHCKINEYLESGEKSLFMRMTYKTHGGDILTDTYFSSIYDNFKDLTGFLVISKENNSRLHVQKAYKITDREFEVVELLLSGLSNKAISEQLGISVRTVESHCLHIYTKLGIKDRIELFTFANEYNLLP